MADRERTLDRLTAKLAELRKRRTLWDIDSFAVASIAPDERDALCAVVERQHTLLKVIRDTCPPELKYDEWAQDTIDYAEKRLGGGDA